MQFSQLMCLIYFTYYRGLKVHLFSNKWLKYIFLNPFTCFWNAWCFQTLDILNFSAKNMAMHTSVWHDVFYTFGKIPRSGQMEFLLFYFLRNLHAAFHIGCISLQWRSILTIDLAIFVNGRILPGVSSDHSVVLICPCRMESIVKHF